MEITNASDLQTERQVSTNVHLRILATSDLHVHILPFDYYTGQSTDRLGFARTASLIKAARAEVENCMLFDNGDFLQGSPLGDYAARSAALSTGEPHPMIAAMNHLAYDAGTLGNHEFNYGLGFLTKSLTGANFPVVSSNVWHAGGAAVTQTLVPPYTMLDRSILDDHGARHAIKIGVIGFTPPQILVWDRRHLAGKLTTTDIVAAATAFVPQMLRDGADLIIALSHSGIEPLAAITSRENASTALAKTDGIDVLIAGHSHLVFPSNDFALTQDVDPAHGTVCGKPAVMPGFYGSHLGVIDLVLSHRGGKYTVQSHRTEARPIWQRQTDGSGAALVETHQGLARLTAAVHRETLDRISQPIGQTPVPLHSFFALVTDTPALNLVAAAQTLHLEKQLATTAFAHLPVLASVAPFKAGGRGGPENYTDVPAGDVMLRHAADLYIHPNTSAALQMTGAEIADWLEYAVGIFNQVWPGSADFPLINPDFPSFNFDLIFGLNYQIDLAQPPRFDGRGSLINPQSRRICGLTFQNTPLDPTQKFAVATNSYRIASNGDYLPPAADRVIYQSTKTNLDLLIQHFKLAQSKLTPPKVTRRFCAIPGTSVTFDTSPKALGHLAELSHLKIEPIGATTNGFLRFRLQL